MWLSVFVLSAEQTSTWLRRKQTTLDVHPCTARVGTDILSAPLLSQLHRREDCLAELRNKTDSHISSSLGRRTLMKAVRFSQGYLRVIRGII